MKAKVEFKAPVVSIELSMDEAYALQKVLNLYVGDEAREDVVLHLRDTLHAAIMAVRV
jgi:hypothetical protein